MDRRKLILGGACLIAAPAIVRYEWIMPVKSKRLPFGVILPPPGHFMEVYPNPTDDGWAILHKPLPIMGVDGVADGQKFLWYRDEVTGGGWIAQYAEGKFVRETKIGIGGRGTRFDFEPPCECSSSPAGYKWMEHSG